MHPLLGLLFIFLFSFLIFYLIFSENGGNIFHGANIHNSGGESSIVYSAGTVVNPRIQPGSTNSSGSVVAAVSAPSSASDTFEIIVNFSTPLSRVPKSVILTAATPQNAIPTPGLQLTVDAITENGFEVIGYSPTAIADGTLFYYLL